MITVIPFDVCFTAKHSNSNYLRGPASALCKQRRKQWNYHDRVCLYWHLARQCGAGRVTAPAHYAWTVIRDSIGISELHKRLIVQLGYFGVVQISRYYPWQWHLTVGWPLGPELTQTICLSNCQPRLLSSDRHMSSGDNAMSSSWARYFPFKIRILTSFLFLQSRISTDYKC